MKEDFELKEDVQQIHIFTGYTSNVKDIQVGKQGPIPTDIKIQRRFK